MMLKNLQEKVLSPEAIEYAIAEYLEQLGTALDSLTDDLAEMRQRKARLEIEVRRLVAAVREAGHSKALLQELARKEGELQTVTDRLLSEGKGSVEARIGEIRTTIVRGLENLRNLLRRRHGPGEDRTTQTFERNQDDSPQKRETPVLRRRGELGFA